MDGNVKLFPAKSYRLQKTLNIEYKSNGLMVLSVVFFGVESLMHDLLLYGKEPYKYS